MRQNKSQSIRVRLTPEDHNKLKQMAEKASMFLSEWIRFKLLGKSTQGTSER